MKLYATTKSDKHGREAKKGGDQWIEIVIANGNNKTARVRAVYDEKLGITYYTLESFLFGKWYQKGMFEQYEGISDNDNRTA